MCSEVPKEFQKTTEVLPFTKYGISSIEDFRKAEKDIQDLEWLKKIGLSNEEVKLYQENEAGLLDQRKKVESSVLKGRLEVIYNKINDFQSTSASSKDADEKPCSSTMSSQEKSKAPMNFYPEEHPMNNLKKLDDEMFGHLKNDDMIPITKRRKILRRLERKKERLLAQQKQPMIPIEGPSGQPRKAGSLWDMQEMPERKRDHCPERQMIGPKKQAMYTIKGNKVMRLEDLPRDDEEEDSEDENRIIDDIAPINPAEEQLLEGTKMCLDDIKKIERFKDYEPGIPSKTLYLKNIASTVSQEQLSLLFNQFLLDNGGPIDLRLLSGRMRGQAFVTFQYEDLAIQALDEINGTILSGQPIIAQFGRNTNRIQVEENR